jgi:hypothetical protein
MKTATITLELTYKEIAAVMAFLNNMPSDFNTSHTANANTSQDEMPTTTVKTPKETKTVSEKVVVKPTAGKKTKMPTFGRTQAQVDAFAKEEAERRKALEAKAALKTAKAKEEESENKKVQEEVSAIKQAELKADSTSSSTLPTKPWLL